MKRRGIVAGALCLALACLGSLPALADKWTTLSIRDGLVPITGDAAPPKINLQVTFAHASAELDRSATDLLSQLGAALQSPELAPYRFEINGHTDASGPDAFNLKLSQERAASVRAFLIERFAIDPGRLTTYGYGETRLLDPAAPRAERNRRVEVVNAGPLAPGPGSDSEATEPPDGRAIDTGGVSVTEDPSTAPVGPEAVPSMAAPSDGDSGQPRALGN